MVHFAAYYNLKKLAKALLKCPGAKEAMSIKNCHGNGPVGVAKLRKHSDIEQLLEDHHVSRYFNLLVWCGVVCECGVVWCVSCMIWYGVWYGVLYNVFYNVLYGIWYGIVYGLVYCIVHCIVYCIVNCMVWYSVWYGVLHSVWYGVCYGVLYGVWYGISPSGVRDYFHQIVLFSFN